MKIPAFSTVFASMLCLSACFPHATLSQTFQGVLTGQYNVNRNSANTQETVLTPSNVAPGAFGLLFTDPVDGNIFAQPLYVPNLSVNGAVHNVVFVATTHNSVYAFDADAPQSPLWHASLGTPATIGQSKFGILSTPVVDLGLNAIFVVACAGSGGAPVYTLYALNLVTGTTIAQIPVQGAVPGTGDGSQSMACVAWNGGAVQPPCIPFNASQNLQRPALLESATPATIFVAFGTAAVNESVVPYHGWLMGYGYSSGAFTQTMLFNTTQNATQTGQACSTSSPPTNQCGHGGGIWMSGRGPALDASGVYAITGNGGFGGKTSGNWAESALRLSNAGVVEDSFTPSNYATLNKADLDLGDAGPILFTSSNPSAQSLMLTAGKTGAVYLLNRASLGGLKSGNSGALQVFTASSHGCGAGPGQSGCYEIHSPAFWPRQSANPIFYSWAFGDTLRVWDFNDATNQFTLDANQGAMTVTNYPGVGLAISANGDDDGILWGILPTAAASTGYQGALYAFDAINPATPLWSGTDYWFATRFTIPTVANGKVYVPTSASPASVTPGYSPQLRVYGLLPPA